jgi:hypothetical protein
MAFIKLTLCFLLFGLTVKGQTFAEWFDQKNTQRSYLLQQIAAFNAYGTVLKSGYNIAQNGLGSIGNSVTSEFNLHTAYYNRLGTASSQVKNNPQIKDILLWQQDIITAFKGLSQDTYQQQVRSAVLKDCDNQLAELQKLITDGKVQMGDADRIKGINKVHTAMLSNYQFTVSFCNQAKAISVNKQHETNDAAILKQYYGNP